MILLVYWSITTSTQYVRKEIDSHRNRSRLHRLLSKDGFCDDGAHSAGSSELQDGGNEMDGEDNQIAHA
jgi:hypothetical protein